ncbi:E3 ubiquitin-protein ligase RNF13 isoform X1 [Hydra vulgaris]|nr:E3 ubiquitin-protein ligase RNF13 [Hydra vulgaris]
MINWYYLLVICLQMVNLVSLTIYTYPPAHSNLSKLMFHDVEADFGSMPTEGISGALDLSIPYNACYHLYPAPKKDLPNTNFFALIQESSGCSYSEQVIHAQEAGYKGAIIYSRTNNDPIIMGGDGPIIVAVYVKKSVGQDLKQFLYKTGSTIKIAPNDPQMSLSIYLVPFAIVVGVCFFFMLAFSVGRYVRYWLRIRRSRLSPANLKKIPTKKFKKGDEFDVCAICIEEYVQNDKIRILPCNHAYHCKCVDPWLTSGKKLCPVCKQTVESDLKRTSKNVIINGNDGNSNDVNGSSALTEESEDENTPLLAASQNLPNSGAMA